MKRIVYACILFASSVAFAETEQIGPFGSLNNTENPFIISATQAQDLLNVDVTEQAKSVRKRKGYATAFTLSNATSPIHGIYNFYDSNGSDVSLFFNDRRLNVSVSGGSPSVYFSTSSNGATYQCVDSAGFAYCANSSRDAILKVNSSTYTLLTGFTSTGTMVTVTPERLVQSGFASNTSLVWFSKANDFTTWTVGGNPVDPIQFTITSPGSGIKHITYAHGRVYWFKDSSFGYILEGLTLADWQVVTVNAFLGTLYNTSIFRDDVLYFQGNDGHFYAFDGTNLVKLSKDIQQTISQTQGRTTNSWTQTSQSDWQASSITPQGYLDTSLNQGSVVLATSSAISPFVDTSSANFAGGTLTNLTTTFMDGALLLTKGSTVTAVSSCAVTSAGIISACQYFRSFTSTTNFILTSVDLNVINQVSTSAQTGYVEIYTDNSLSAGTLLSSGSTSVSSSGDGFFTFGLNSEVQISSGTRYWIKWQSSNCNPGTGLFLHTDNGNYSCNLNEYDYVSSPPASSGADSVYRLNGRFYDTSGNIVSRSFDNSTTTNTWNWDWSTLY